MNIEEIKELMKALSESSFSKFTFKKGDVELHLEKEKIPVRVSPQMMFNETVEEAAFQAEIPLKGARGGTTRPEPQVSGTFVTSPMVGTFYATPAPDQPGFVKLGDHVEKDTVVCIVEAMKVMNEVKAGVSGKIVEILAHNGQPVEFGTKLFRVQ